MLLADSCRYASVNIAMPKRVTIGGMNSCHVAAAEIRLEITDRQGASLELVATPEQIASLLMSLPRLLSASLRHRFGDDSLRVVFPLQEYTVEKSSDSVNVILSLKTSDGFAVSFSVSPELSRPLALGLDMADVAGAERSRAH